MQNNSHQFKIYYVENSFKAFYFQNGDSSLTFGKL